jgi:hypothetical protein
MARALSIIGAAAALALVGPSGTMNAGTTQRQSLTIAVNWPASVVLRRAGQATAHCKNWLEKPCPFQVRAAAETKLTAELPYDHADGWRFVGWQGAPCRGGLVLQPVCTFTMPTRALAVRARFARKERHGTTFPSGGGTP